MNWLRNPFHRFGRHHGQNDARFPSGNPFDLDQPLLQLSGSGDALCVRDACEGTGIFGATGSGKTTGSGHALARAYLASGFGGLVLTAKNDERRRWEALARATGRAEDVMIFSPDSSSRFNFLDYELTRSGSGAGHTENLVNLFATVLEIAERKQRYAAEPYWQRATKQLLRNTIDIVVHATGTVSLPALYRVITSAPGSTAMTHNREWQRRSFCFQCIVKGDERDKGEIAKHDFDLAVRYWLSEFPTLAEKTRSIIVSTFTSMADCLLRGTLRELFCTTTTIVPEVTLDGGILIVDMPVKEFGELGIISQVLMKYVWQQAVERRVVSVNPRPVFLWCDEAQHFYTSYDREFQATARSSRAATVYLTQSLPSFYSALGGEHSGKAETDAFLTNLQTKIFHCNSDPVTNSWAADLCSRSYQYRHNFGAAGTERRSSHSAGVSESLDYEILPREFSRLRTGGPEHGFLVDAILFRSGRAFRASGKNFLRVQFQQEKSNDAELRS